MANLEDFANSEIERALEDKASTYGDAPGLQTEGKIAILMADPGADYGSIERAFLGRGLDPREWVVERALTNDWDVTAFARKVPIKATNHQLKLHLRRMDSYIQPARLEGPIFPRVVRPAFEGGKPELWALLTDLQCPYLDDTFIDYACQWIEDNQPAHILIGGDNVDLPLLSKYMADPKNDVSVQECVNSFYRLGLRIRTVAPMADIRVLGGNHDARADYALRTKLPAIWDLKRAHEEEEAPGLPVMSIPYLLRLDELGFNWVTNDLGDYPHGHLDLDPAPVAIYHGWVVKPSAGQSALETAKRLGRSCGIGHTHRQAITHFTQGTKGRRREYTAVESGVMGDRERFAYGVGMDQQMGFSTFTVWPDGAFQPDLARYRNSILTWRDQRYG